MDITPWTLIVNVMFKTSIHDAQGTAITNAVRGSLGFAQVISIRQGKRFEIEVNGSLEQDAVLELGATLGHELLANMVIEQFTVTATKNPTADLDVALAAFEHATNGRLSTEGRLTANRGFEKILLEQFAQWVPPPPQVVSTAPAPQPAQAQPQQPATT